MRQGKDTVSASRTGRLGLIAAGVGVLAGLGGCRSDPARSGGGGGPAERPRPGDGALAETGRELFGVRGDAPDGARAEDAWTIVVACYPDGASDETIAWALDKVRSAGNLPEAYAERRERGTILAYGRYADPGDARAHADLRTVRAIEADGTRPFAQAFLAPPPDAARAGSLPELDLINAARLYGQDKAVYTLQIGVYGRADLERPSQADLAEFRKHAEQAAAQLRREGELAFYYHGPNRSSVTIGVFGEDDYDPMKGRPESAALQAARKSHPNNLFNGMGQKRRIPGTNEFRLESSALVVVPK